MEAYDKLDAPSELLEVFAAVSEGDMGCPGRSYENLRGYPLAGTTLDGYPEGIPIKEAKEYVEAAPSGTDVIKDDGVMTIVPFKPLAIAHGDPRSNAQGFTHIPSEPSLAEAGGAIEPEDNRRGIPIVFHIFQREFTEFARLIAACSIDDFFHPGAIFDHRPD